MGQVLDLAAETVGQLREAALGEGRTRAPANLAG